MEFFKKIWKMIESQNRKKLIENTAIVIIIGIIVIIAGSTIFGGDNSDANTDKSRNETEVIGYKNQTSRAEADETRLKSLLSRMQGVGKVDVMITYFSTSESVPAYDIQKNQNNTEEKDSGGGTRSIRQEEYNSSMVYEDSTGGGKEPVIIKILEPEVKGVLVVAEGADSVEVRESILSAVSVVLDIPIHRVQVQKMQK